MVCHVEREAYPASTLVARMEDKALDQAPIWDDITTFDGRPWRGLVDVVTAGLPCQPYSLAGERKGHDDERALWPEFVRIVRECEPAVVFLENVSAFLRFYGPVWAELSSLGFIHAPPLLLTGHEKGAIHERRRLFVLAAHPDRRGRETCELHISGDKEAPNGAGRNQSFTDTNSERLQGHARNEHRAAGRQGGQTGSSAEGSESTTDAIGERAIPRSDKSSVQSETWQQNGRDAERRDIETTNPNGQRLTFEWSGWLFDSERQTLRHDTDRCGDGCRTCGSIWETESPTVRVDHGSANRLVELRATGNGVVPIVAACAWNFLWRALSK